MNDKLKCADALDVARFVLSLMVVLIHLHAAVLTNRFGGAELPVLRMAVPIFFMISSFLLFRRLDGRNDRTELKRFLKRNLLLYAAWFVVLFPLTYPYKQYFAAGIIDGLRQILLCFFFYSTFFSSWFLSALIIGTLIVYLLSRKLGNRALLCIGVLTYALCCLVGSYRGLFSAAGFVALADSAFPYGIVNSFPVSIVWIAMGKCFADRSADRRLLHKRSLLFPVLSLVPLFAEALLILRLDCASSHDCYFMLLLTVPLWFDWILSSELHCSCARKLRQTSVVIYCLHGDMLFFLAACLRLIGVDASHLSIALLLYVVVVAICLICAAILRALARRFRLFRVFL